MLTPIQDKRLAQQTRKLEHIQQLSQSARTAWFGLLALLVFVGVTLMGHKDADFFAYGAATQLPLVNVEVDPTAFFIGASILTAALYIHLHLHLFNLWHEIGSMEPTILDGAEGKPERLSARIYPTLMTSAALLYRNRVRKDGSCHVLPLGWAVELITWLLVWAFGLVILGLLWLRFAPVHNVWISILIGACFWAALMTGISGWTIFSARLSARKIPPPGMTRWAGIASSALCVLVLSYGYAGGPGSPIFARANLAEAKITSAPKDWLGYEEWKKEHEYTFRKRIGAALDKPLPPEKQRELEQERPLRWAARLDDIDLIDLQGADLIGANLTGAFLAGAKLKEAQLKTADLSFARLEGAVLRGARMEGADLSGVLMERADLSFARMEGAVLREARMEGADFSEARMEGANLSFARLEGVILSAAWMEGADFSWARMEGAVLRDARMEGAVLSRARMDGADLWGARMEGVTLSAAWMEGADFSGARVRAASCNTIFALATVLHDAEYTCPDLTQASLQGFVGNARTLLPHGLSVDSCLPAGTEGLEEALTKIPESQESHPFSNLNPREEVRARVVCEPGTKPHATGVWAFEKRFDPGWFQGRARWHGIGIRKASRGSAD
ncbi:MAG: pentapeptide repeat-containing protein [Pseudomonadota bacterium]